MADSDLITLRNKRTGEMVRVPRSQFVQEEPSKGWAGIGEDIEKSLSSAPDSFASLISALPGQLKGAGKQIVTDPIRAINNLGGGVRKGIEGFINTPSNIASYLGSKGIGRGGIEELIKKIRIPESDLEERLLGPIQDGDEFLRGVGSFAPYARIGAGAKGLSSLAKRGAGAAAYGAGQNQDPLHAALAGVLGDVAAKALPQTPAAAVKAVKATPETIRRLPEHAGSALSSALETSADYASKIPGAAGIAQPTLGALASYLKHLSVTPEELAQRKLFGDLTSADLPGIRERAAAGKRLGLDYNTIAELSDSPFEARKQGTIGRTRQGEKLLYEQGKKRSESEQTAIDTLLDNIYDPEKLAPEKKAKYDATMSDTVPEEFVQKYSSDPIVEKVIKEMEGDSVYKKALQGVPKNSFEYWDNVKGFIDDMEQNTKKDIKQRRASIIGKTRKELLADMDKINPEYKQARKISERDMVRRKIAKFFDKREMEGNQFAKFLKSKEQFNELMHKLEPFPEATQNLKDMKMLFGDLIPNNPSLRTATAMERNSMANARNKLDALKRELDQKYGEKHDVAAVELMTKPHDQLLDALTKYLERKGK